MLCQISENDGQLWHNKSSKVSPRISIDKGEMYRFISAPNPDVSYSPDESDLIDPLLVPQTLIDRLLGCAYGQALGDAYGLSTEFETREQIAQTYPDASKLIPFPNYILTNHSKRWRQGDWTDDTDQWILMLETILHDNGDVKAFAKRLKRWIDCGFPELGDKAGMGIGAHVYQVL